MKMENELIKITTNDEGVNCVSARELYEGLGATERFQQWFDKRVKKYGFKENLDFISVKDFRLVNNGAKREVQDYIITLELAKELCIIEKRNKRGAEILQYLLSLDNKEIVIIEPERPEIEFLNGLEETLEPLNIKGIRQYSVLNYRIDYYIEDYKLAIEYDENDHKGYTYEQQELRQQLIEKELGCKFVRLSDSKSNFYNIGLVIKEILTNSKMRTLLN